MAKELNDFCDAVRTCIAAIDAEMGKPSDVERGKRIAKITNHLDLSLQIFERYHKKDYKKSRPANALAARTSKDAPEGSYHAATNQRGKSESPSEGTTNFRQGTLERIGIKRSE